MGDSTALEQIVFSLLVAGVPTLLFGLPVIVLVLLYARRQLKLAAKRESTRD